MSSSAKPSARPPTSSLYCDHTLIDNDLYQDTTTENGHPAAETASDTLEMNPVKQRPAPPVYAAVHKNRPGNFVDQSEPGAPASSSSPSIDHDMTLVENDLYR